MFTYGFCVAGDSRKEPTFEVVRIGHRHFLLEGVYSSGDRPFSRKMVESVRLMLCGKVEPGRSVITQVYEFRFHRSSLR